MIGLPATVRAIHAGGVVAYPTEHCYGFGCDPRNIQAIQRVLMLKQRKPRQGLILIASHLDQLIPWIRREFLSEEILASWPGPVTWLIPARAWVLPWVRGRFSSVAVRMTAHPIASGLCTQAGSALISTSANLHGQPPLRDGFAVARQFGSRLDDVLHGPVGSAPRPSQIRDALSGTVIRA